MVNKHKNENRSPVIFSGTLNRGIKRCCDCSCLTEVRRKRFVDGAQREVIFNMCFGVSEPFEVYDTNQECTEYKEHNLCKKDFKSIESFINLLSEEEALKIYKSIKNKYKNLTDEATK